MKPTLILVIFASILLVGCYPPGPDKDHMMTMANELDARFIAAFNSQDIDGIMECYWNSPDLVNYDFGSMSIHGWDAVKEEMGSTFEMMSGGTLSLVNQNQIVGSELVVGHGTWSWSTTLPDGTPLEMMGRYTDVKAERDGKWVYLMDHVSAPMPGDDNEHHDDDGEDDDEDMDA